MDKDRSKLMLGFVIGAAVGAAIGYFLASDKKDEIVSDIKDAAGKVKDEVNKQFEKGKQVAEELKNKAGEFFSES